MHNAGHIEKVRINSNQKANSRVLTGYENCHKSTNTERQWPKLTALDDCEIIQLKSTSTSSQAKRKPQGGMVRKAEKKCSSSSSKKVPREMGGYATGTSNKMVESSDIKIRQHQMDLIKSPIENVLVYVTNESEEPMLKTINNLRLETPILTKPNVMVTARHLDQVCGLNEIETNNNWTLSLLPNRQIRLEDKDHCFHLRVYTSPVIENYKVTVEGCLVPGGHLFRLTFDGEILATTRDAWLTLSDRRWICNDVVLNYMIKHPYGSLESIRSKLGIAFVYDPNLAEDALQAAGLYDCYYCQRHFYYKSVDNQFSGQILVGKWGARCDIGTLFLLPEGAPDEGTDYLMAKTFDLAWFRAWKATIYADFKNLENADLMTTSIQKLQVMPLITDFLEVCRSPHHSRHDKFTVAKFVFDYASRQLTTVSLASKKECFECHRIVAQPEGEEKSYDFRITGLNKKTDEVIDLLVRVVAQENLPLWIEALIIPLPRAYVFLQMLLEELAEKKCTLCDIESKEPTPHTFVELTQLIAILPKVKILSTVFSNLSPKQLEHLALLTFDALYMPLISLKAAKKIATERNNDDIVELCGKENARILQLVQQHIRKRNKKIKSQRKPIWLKLVSHYMRLNDLQIDSANDLLQNVADYFDNALYSTPV